MSPATPALGTASGAGRRAAAASAAPSATGFSSLPAALRRVGPLAIAGMVANGANVVVTVVIAHLLSNRGYGSLTELVALFLMLSMPGSALLVAVVRRVMVWSAAGADDRVALWVARVRRTSVLALMAWAVVAVAVRVPLAHLLALPRPAGVSEVLIAGGAWALLSVERGLVQSRRAYGALARNLCVEAGVRTALTVGLVAAGLGVEGAALALVAAMAASLVDARRSLGPIPAAPPVAASAVAASAVAASAVAAPAVAASAVAAPTLPARRHLAADLATALGALGLLAALQNLDVLIVGHDAPSKIGAYGAISVSSKAVVFAALVLCGYLLPEAVFHSQRGGHALHQLAVALGLLAIPVVILGGLAAFAPTSLLRLFFGPDKTQAAPALATLALAMGCLAASVLLTHYLLGVGRRRVVALLAVAVAALVGAVAAAQGAPLATARAELGLQGALAAVLAVMVLRVPRRSSQAAAATAA